MAGWREEDHPRDEAGRWIFKGLAPAVQRKRTVRDAQHAEESDLVDVFVRLVGKEKLSRKDEADLVVLDAELNRRQAGGERVPTLQEQRVESLLAEGRSYEDAYRDAYGDQGDQGDDSGRRRGESRDKMRRRHFSELTALAVLQAETECRGYLLNKRGRAAGVDPASLFTGPRARAEAYASEELRRWWENNPRRTYAEYRAEAIGDARTAGAARSRRRQAGNGKDFG